MDNNKKTLNKKELLIFGVLLIAAGIAWMVISHFQKSKDYGSIRVTVGVEEFGTYDLGKDQEIDVDGHNTIVIKDGQAYMSDAQCPDHLCMSMAPIDERGGLIVCLPNETLIEGIPAEGADAKTGIDLIGG